MSASDPVQCPKCKKAALVIGDGDPKCGACRYTDTAERAAERYAKNIAGINVPLMSRDGGESPISECPSCEMGETLLDLGASQDGASNSLRFICFNCGDQLADGGLQQCDGAGSRGPHWASPYDAAVCDACIADVVSRDNS